MNQEVKITELDRLTMLPHMQLIKAALPYIHLSEQRFFSFFIKFRELEQTMRLFQDGSADELGICSLEESGRDSPIDMLKAIRPYGTEEEQDSIDLVLNFIEGSRLYEAYQKTSTAKPPTQSRKETETMEPHNWKQDPRLRSMNPEKIKIMEQLTEQVQNTPRDKLLPLLLSLRSQSHGLSFSSSEMDLLFSILTDGMNPAQKQQAETIRMLMGRTRPQT